MENENALPDQDERTVDFPVRKSRKFYLILVASLLCLLLGGTYFIYSTFALPGERRLGNFPSVPTPTPKQISSSIGEIPSWHKPEFYIASDESQNLVVGNFANNQEKTVAKNKGGPLGAPTFQALSRSGKYLLYTQLPENLITNYTQNPPYEFHGSNDFELHLVTINEDGQTKDEVVDTNVAIFLGEAIFAFDKDEEGFYYPKYENEKDVTYYYSIGSRSHKDTPLPGYLTSGAASSPSFSHYVLVDALPKDISDTSVNNTYNLMLYTRGDAKPKILYSKFISGENSLLFPSDKFVFLAREDYVDGPNSVCSIEQVSVPDGVVTPLIAQNCPPGFSNTNYHDLSLSPDGKFLVAEYSENSISDRTNSGSFFLYNFQRKSSEIIAKGHIWYGKYFWISNTEFLTNESASNAPPEPHTVYRVNISTGDAVPEEALKGKTLFGVW